MTPRPSPTRAALAALAAIALAPFTAAADVVPTIDTPVTDQARLLTPAEREAISARLVDHRVATGVQIAVLTVRTTHGVPIEDFALKVAEAWGGGSEKRSDGVLLVLAIDDRRSRLEVGYDLEAKISDGKARLILDDMKPALRGGQYGTAISRAVANVINRTGGMEPVVPYTPSSTSSSSSSGGGGSCSGCDGSSFAIAMIIIFMVLGAFFGDGSGGSFSASSSSSSYSSSSWSSSSRYSGRGQRSRSVLTSWKSVCPIRRCLRWHS